MAAESESIVIEVDSSQVTAAAEAFGELGDAAEEAGTAFEDAGESFDDAAEGLEGVEEQAQATARATQEVRTGAMRMAAGLAAGFVTWRTAKRLFSLAGDSLREFAEKNPDVQARLDETRGRLDAAKESFGAFLYDVAQSTGALRAFDRALVATGQTLDAIADRHASGLRAVTNVEQLEQYREQFQRLGREIVELDREMQSLSIGDVVSGRAREVQAEWDAATAAYHDYERAIEAGSRAVAERAASDIQGLVERFSTFRGEIRQRGGGGGRAQSEAVEAEIEAQRALQVELGKQQAISDLRATVKARDEEERAARLAQMQADAEAQIEIERAKQQAISDLRASVKAREDEERAAAIEAQVADAQRVGSMISASFGAIFASVGQMAAGQKTSMRKALRSVWSGMLVDEGTAQLAFGAFNIIPPPFNPKGNPPLGAWQIAKGAGAIALGEMWGASGGGKRSGGGGTPSQSFSAPIPRSLPPAPAQRQERPIIAPTINAGIVGDIRGLARMVVDVIDAGERHGIRPRARAT